MRANQAASPARCTGPTLTRFKGSVAGGVFQKATKMSKQPRNEGTKKTDKPRDAVEKTIGGNRVSEMTADELIEAMKRIVLELDRRNPKADP
jgi:hypothetical protein